MSITLVAGQAGGDTTDAAAQTLNTAFTANVTAGNLVTFSACKNNGTAFIAGDCTATGTATLTGGISLDKTYTFDFGAANNHTLGFWSAIVTGTGTLTLRAGGAAGTYWCSSRGEWVSTVGWDTTRVEAATAGTGNATDNQVTATSGSATSAGAALFLATYMGDGSGAQTIDPDSAPWVQIFEEENAAAHQIGSFQYRLTTIGLTDTADWTITGANLGAAAAMVVYREIAGAGGGSIAQLTMLGVGR